MKTIIITTVNGSDTYNVLCALIFGKRKERTNKKTSLNDALREYDVAV